MRMPKWMKRCGKCERTLEAACFAVRYRKNGRLQSWCRECRRVYDAVRYGGLERERCRAKNRALRQRNRDFVFNYLSKHPCVDCGETDPVVLEFDHIRGTKCFAVAWAVGNALSLSKIRKEIAKCAVRCANCHRRRTYEECGAHRSRAVAQPGSAPVLGAGGRGFESPSPEPGKPRGKPLRGFPHVHLLLKSHAGRTDPEVVRAALVVIPRRRKRK